jgi:hypothetical protein
VHPYITGMLVADRLAELRREAEEARRMRACRRSRHARRSKNKTASGMVAIPNPCSPTEDEMATQSAIP